MIFWISAIAICLCAAAYVAWPLVRRRRNIAGENPDIAVYRDQLEELEAEIARGVIDPDEAESSRAEIGRRLLAAARSQDQTRADAPAGSNAIAIPLLIAVLAFGSFGIYNLIGVPGLPDQPLAQRQAGDTRIAQKEAEELVAEAVAAEFVTPSERDTQLLNQLRDVLETRRDPRGFEILARTLASLNQFPEAARAYGELVTLKGQAATADDLGAWAEMMIFAARGYVSPEAENALAQALNRDNTDRRARYYSGVALAQSDKPELAIGLWSGLLAEGPADAEWKAPVKEQIRILADTHNMPLPEIMLRGPTREDVEAAQDMNPEDRMEMIRGMVSGLEDRLATEGGEPREWAQLIRALGVLGQTDRAATIAAEARAAFAGNDDALRIINEAGQ